MFEELYEKLQKEIENGDFNKCEQYFEEYKFRNGQEIKNILVIEINSIGDAICSSGCIREIRKNYPNAYITLIHNIDTKEVFECCPYIDNMIGFDYVRDLSIKDACLYILDFCKKKIWDRKYDLSFYFRRSFPNFTHAALSFFSGARIRNGYDVESSFSYSKSDMKIIRKIVRTFIPNYIIPPQVMTLVIAKNFYVLQQYGFTIQNFALELWYTKQCLNKVQKILDRFPQDSKKCLLCIGGSIESKRYPVEQYAVAIKELLKKHQNFYFIISGGNDVIQDSIKLEQELSSDRVLNLCGILTLMETMALTSLIDIYLGNDTCVMHMASIHRKFIIELSRCARDIEQEIPNYTESILYQPYNVSFTLLKPNTRLKECSNGLYWGGCKYIHKPHCITQILPNHIVAAFEQYIGFEL